MRILYVTTTFPVFSETFLQREARALLKAGVELTIVSLHGGKDDFEGHPVHRFSKWSLLKLLYLLPAAAIRDPLPMSRILSRLNVERPPSFLNTIENLLGFGAAIVQAKWIRSLRLDRAHSVWASAPAAYAMLISELAGLPFSTGAHAYDVFEHGGDWLLKEKLRRAQFTHTSTEAAARRIGRLCPQDKVKLIRRGLSQLPPFKPTLRERAGLRIVCVARLVEKKGFPYQLKIYEALRERGIAFKARIIGDGPLEEWLRRRIGELHLGSQVSLTGRLSESEVMDQLQWADAMFHTGVVAKSGDRDGLPNVIPEAMASGVIVVASPVSGVVEAVVDGETGYLCDVRNRDAWVSRCELVLSDVAACAAVAKRARDWVEREFVADVNSARLIACMRCESQSSQISSYSLESSVI